MPIISDNLSTITLIVIVIFFLILFFTLATVGGSVPNKLVIQHQESQSQTSLAITYKRLFHRCWLAIFFHLFWS